MPREQWTAAIRALSPEQATRLKYEWRFWARDKQLTPPGRWANWLILAGRNWGKTRTGAAWIQEQVEKNGVGRVALIARTSADIYDVMLEGKSGLLNTAPPWFRPKWNPSKRRLTWPNGAIGTTFTAEEPEQLRGPQFEKAWCDELGAWRYGEEAWEQLQMVLRVGDNPQACITTTPRPTKLIKRLAAGPETVVTRGSTFENDTAPEVFLQRLRQQFGGSRLARQELYAEILDDNPGALWKRDRIDELRVTKHPDLVRIVVGVDPAVSADASSDETGIVVAGLGSDGHGYVLDDRSLIASPATWASEVVAAYRSRAADRIVAEVNNGGALVESAIRTVDRDVSYKAVHASRGKAIRAEPVAALYEQGRVHHVGSLAKLEDQLCEWDPTVSKGSPDRLDALVWALTELMLEGSDDDGEIFISRGSQR